MKTQRLSLDRISTLPPLTIERILCLVTIEEAASTSTLSREWRYHWTKIPKVAFYEDMFDESTDEKQLPIIEQRFGKSPSERKKMSRRSKLFNAICQFLLLHQGPLVDFTLSMRTMKSSDTSIDIVEMVQIILHLSRMNTVKKLRLSCMYDLPLSIFSFHRLTDLHLYDCGINNPPTFNGFGSLTTLYLEYVDIYKNALMHILSNNPLLKSFTMLTRYETIMVNEDSTIIDLFQCLHAIEHLTFCVWDIQCFGGGTIPRKLRTSLVHLKCLCLERMSFLEKDWLRFLVLLIKSSPNLEKLKLQMLHKDIFFLLSLSEEDDIESLTLEDYEDIVLEHLIEFEIGINRDLKPELEFVKLILAKSPILKNVRIFLNDKVTKDEDLEMLRVLLHSPMVEIIGEGFAST